MKKTESIYLVHEKDNPTICYAGRTGQKLHVRLGKHISGAKNGGGTKKDKWIREVLARGGELVITLLETVDLSEPSSAEDLWVSNLAGAGATVMNSKAGDADRYIYIPDGSVSTTPWTPKAFEGKWVKGAIGANAGELCLYVNGIAFYRKGKTKLRFRHPVYGEHHCRNFLWEGMIERACAYFTEGTEENKRMKNA